MCSVYSFTKATNAQKGFTRVLLVNYATRALTFGNFHAVYACLKHKFSNWGFIFVREKRNAKSSENKNGRKCKVADCACKCNGYNPFVV